MKTTLTTTKLKATIHHHGAELVSLKTLKNNREYIWEGNPEYWGKHSPVLFPIVGTLKENSFSYNGEEFQLQRHGFARDRVFELIHHTEDEAVFSLKSDKATFAVYPFDFELQLHYSLTYFGLTVTYEVMNKGSEVLYFSLGGHPALALPNNFEDYSLRFEPNEILLSYRLENDLLSDKTVKIPLKDHLLPLTYQLFENDALIFKGLQSKTIRLLENNIPLLDFRFSDFPDFGIWTKKGAPFICLEPWLGYSDLATASGSIADKEGIQKLQSNTSGKYSFSIEIL